MNRLYFGDNLEVLDEHVADESVDLVYLDPPFNSNRNYSVIFGRNRAEDESAAQIQAFEDTWKWTPTTEVLIGDLSNTAPTRVADALSAYYTLLGESEALAYLVNMTPRLLQLHRVLKPTGSLYLHCDPTMSHYLKVLLDAMFGAERFIAEVIWKRTSAHNRVRRFGPVHDVILGYAKGANWTWNPQYVDYDKAYVDRDYRRVEEGTGRRYRISDVTSNRPGSRYEWKGMPPPGQRYWAYAEATMKKLEAEGRLVYSSTGYPQVKRYLDEMRGQLVNDVWTDIQPINNRAAERLGYPTQKPLQLLERIIAASSNPGDVVLDPFCGCGTSVDAAQRLGRTWIGIDITHLAIDVIARRLRHTFGNEVFKDIELAGIPKDIGGARALFRRSPLEFERWAVSMINAEPNEKQVGDKGVDGVARFPLGGKGKIGKLIVSVKGGKAINPAMVRELSGAVEARKAQMGVLITLAPATKGVTDAINHGGVFTHPGNGQKYPRLQHITVAELLAKKRPQVPPTFLPYIAAQRHTVTLEQATLYDTA